MSVGPMGLSGSFAAAPLAQNRASEQTTGQGEADKTRATQSERRAEMAAGIGQTEEQGNTQDRDADGRRPWELAARTNSTETPSEEQSEIPRSRDANGDCGNSFDALG